MPVIQVFSRLGCIPLLFLGVSILAIVPLVEGGITQLNRQACLDYGRPFSGNNGLSFCTSYSINGCCTADTDSVVQELYLLMGASTPSNVWASCSHHAKSLLCQKCSPYALQIHEGQTSNPRNFPGLCHDFCLTLYNECKDLIKPYMDIITNNRPTEEYNQMLHAIKEGPIAFCDVVKLYFDDFCFAGSVLPNVSQEKDNVKRGRERIRDGDNVNASSGRIREIDTIDKGSERVREGDTIEEGSERIRDGDNVNASSGRIREIDTIDKGSERVREGDTIEEGSERIRDGDNVNASSGRIREIDTIDKGSERVREGDTIEEGSERIRDGDNVNASSGRIREIDTIDKGSERVREGDTIEEGSERIRDGDNVNASSGRIREIDTIDKGSERVREGDTIEEGSERIRDGDNVNASSGRIREIDTIDKGSERVREGDTIEEGSERIRDGDNVNASSGRIREIDTIDKGSERVREGDTIEEGSERIRDGDNVNASSGRIREIDTIDKGSERIREGDTIEEGSERIRDGDNVIASSGRIREIDTIDKGSERVRERDTIEEGSERIRDGDNVNASSGRIREIDTIDKGSERVREGDTIEEGSERIRDGDNVNASSGRIREIDTIDKGSERIREGDNIEEGSERIRDGDNVIASSGRIREIDTIDKGSERVRERDTIEEGSERIRDGDNVNASSGRIREKDTIDKGSERVRERDTIEEGSERIRDGDNVIASSGRIREIDTIYKGSERIREGDTIEEGSERIRDGDNVNASNGRIREIDTIDKGSERIREGDTLDTSSERIREGDTLDTGSGRIREGDTIDLGSERIRDGDNVNASSERIREGDTLDTGSERIREGDTLDTSSERIREGDTQDQGSDRTREIDIVDKESERTGDGEDVEPGTLTVAKETLFHSQVFETLDGFLGTMWSSEPDISNSESDTVSNPNPGLNQNLVSDELHGESVPRTSENQGQVSSLASSIANATKQNVDGCLCLEEIAMDLRMPVSLVHSNDGSNRMFVAEQYGAVNILYPDGTQLSEPLIDISSRIGPLQKMAEEGIGDIAFHPNFKTNGLFYILFSTPEKTNGTDHQSNLAEFKISSTNDNKADPNYFRLLLKIPEPHWKRNAEKLLFGADGYLYIFTGDGGGTPNKATNYAQNMKKLNGKVLRIDVDKQSDDLPYGIPADNPFLDPLPDGSYALPEIYAMGFRNPWSCGVDEGDSITGYGRGRIICGDVGQDNEEELNMIESGGNYGWNVIEGTEEQPFCFGCELAQATKENLVSPIFSYKREARLGKAVIGGEFYRGCLYPQLNGLFLWGDHYSGSLFRLFENESGGWQNTEVDMCDSNVCKGSLTNTYASKIVAFGRDENGEVYVISVTHIDPFKKTGRVYRIVDPHNQEDPATCKHELENKQKVEEKSNQQQNGAVAETDKTTTSPASVLNALKRQHIIEYIKGKMPQDMDEKQQYYQYLLTLLSISRNMTGQPKVGVSETTASETVNNPPPKEDKPTQESENPKRTTMAHVSTTVEDDGTTMSETSVQSQTGQPEVANLVEDLPSESYFDEIIDELLDDPDLFVMIEQLLDFTNEENLETFIEQLFNGQNLENAISTLLDDVLSANPTVDEDDQSIVDTLFKDLILQDDSEASIAELREPDKNLLSAFVQSNPSHEALAVELLKYPNPFIAIVGLLNEPETTDIISDFLNGPYVSELVSHITDKPDPEKLIAEILTEPGAEAVFPYLLSNPDAATLLEEQLDAAKLFSYLENEIDFENIENDPDENANAPGTNAQEKDTKDVKNWPRIAGGPGKLGFGSGMIGFLQRRRGLRKLAKMAKTGATTSKTGADELSQESKTSKATNNPAGNGAVDLNAVRQRISHGRFW